MRFRARPARNEIMSILNATAQPMRAGVIPSGQKTPAGDGALSDSIMQVALAGWIIIALFFGGIGSWAATAPLNGAIVGKSIIKVEGNRKSVQHLDGGNVKNLRVKEGDKINTGNALIVHDAP